MHRSFLWRLGLIATLGAATAAGQGPASCGFHLDVITTDTSTHSPIADMAFTVGDIVGIPPGAPGNPYCGWTPLGSPFRLVVTVPGGTMGPAPYGARIARDDPLLGRRAPTQAAFHSGRRPPHVHGNSAHRRRAPVRWRDRGRSGPPRTAADLRYGGPRLPEPIQRHALLSALLHAAGRVSGRRDDAVRPGSHQRGDVDGRTESGRAVAPGRRSSRATSFRRSPARPTTARRLFVATPPGFMFYGVPTPFCDVDTNGFVDFCFGAATCGGADVASLSTAAGCGPALPFMRPRINVNHYNADFTITPPAPMVSGL